jgi:membrane-bound lytic murein transglycosylase D
VKHKAHFAFLVIAALLLSASRLSAWGLADVLTPDGRPGRPQRTVQPEFDPESHILFLPPLGDKPFLESVRDLSICRDAQVRLFIFRYLTAGREYTTGAFRRSRLYLEPVRSAMEEDGTLPGELALLPLLESAYNPWAVSPSGAVGLWQFLQGTSRVLDMKIDPWVDERRDPGKSTRAAVRHLKNLYSIFGSWDLTLAAYNGGAGYVKRAMIRTRSKSLRELQRKGALRPETSQYVARFAALVVLYNNGDLFGLEDDGGALTPVETGVLAVEYPASLRLIAEKTGTPLETIRQLNPELKTNITPPGVKDYPLRLPAGAKQLLEADLEKTYVIKYASLKKHVVRRGECINVIARRYNTTPRAIMLLNDLRPPWTLHPGQRLYIPI